MWCLGLSSYAVLQVMSLNMKSWFTDPLNIVGKKQAKKSTLRGQKGPMMLQSHRYNRKNVSKCKSSLYHKLKEQDLGKTIHILVCWWIVNES